MAKPLYKILRQNNVLMTLGLFLLHLIHDSQEEIHIFIKMTKCATRGHFKGEDSREDERKIFGKIVDMRT